MYEWSRVIFAKKSKFHDAGGPDTVVSPNIIYKQQNFRKEGWGDIVETEFRPPNSTNFNVDAFRDETDTKIDLPDSGSDSDMITITGKKPNVNKAVAEIQKIQNEMANITSQEVKIPAKIHNTMIGAGGKLIQSIMNECGGVSCGCGCFSCLFLFGIFWTSLNVFLLDGLCRKFICCWQYSFFLAIYVFSVPNR